MADQHMATLGKSDVTVNVISETNSVTWKLNAAGITKYSTGPAYVRLQDNLHEDQTHGDGMNVRVFDGTTRALKDRKQFLFTTTASAANNAFVTYMNSLSAIDIVVLTTGKNCRSDAVVDAWFASYGSVAWPGAFVCNNYEVAYAALYAPNKKKIVQEGALFDDGADKGRATIETVFDVVQDIGSVGFPLRSVYEQQEYAATTGGGFKNYPINGISKLSDYYLKPNTSFQLNAELFTQKSLFDAGTKCRMTVNWYQGSTIIAGQSKFVENTKPDVWEHVDLSGFIPANADGFNIGASRVPASNTVAKTGIRNLAFTESTRYDMGDSRPAAFGVNGIKVANLNETADYPLILNLPDPGTYKFNTVPVQKLIELETSY